MLSQAPKTRSELIRALQRASFRAFAVEDLNTPADVQKVATNLMRHVYARKTACVVVLLDK